MISQAGSIVASLLASGPRSRPQDSVDTSVPRASSVPQGAADKVTLSQAAISRTETEETSDQYDFSSMTPATMKQVADKLYRSGKIDLDQLFKLQNMGVPLGKAGPNGEFIPLTEQERAGYENTPVNYISTTQSAIQFLEQTGYAADPKSGYAGLKNLLVTLLDGQRGQGAGSANS